MKQLNIDIETRSEIDLSKAGVYRYAEGEEFDILVLGYSVDLGPVKVIDLAGGEKVPDEFIDGLFDENVLKFAFNAQFERVCLGRYFGKRLDPASWRCTMISSLYLGLTGSLVSVGELLNLEKQKMTEGKNLIKLFCVPQTPSKSNGMRTWIEPGDAPKDWEIFKEYNRRDVETEIGIYKKLQRFPVPMYVWEQYALDQRINDNGVKLDLDLARQAVKCDGIFRERYMKRAQTLTGLENPNSPIQLKEWLESQGVYLETLSKKEVKDTISKTTGKAREVLELRQLLSKSSIKKYESMITCCCSDGRAHGLLQFYGANRTGRWCLTGDHEVLTENGWIRLDEWKGGKIACWRPVTEAISFQESNSLCFAYEGDMYEYNDSRISQLSTPDHKMYVKRRYDGEWQTDTVENMSKYRPSIPFTGYRRSTPSMDAERLRVLIMTQADGHFTETGAVQFRFRKQRKVERCKKLLRAAGIIFSFRQYEEDGMKSQVVKISVRNVPLWLRMFDNKTFDTWVFNESADVFFDELSYWDSYKYVCNSYQYVTCNKKNADIVQAFAHISGLAATLVVKKREKDNWNNAYYLNIWNVKKNCHEIRIKPTVTSYKGNVYCAETPTGFFIVRRNGKVWVTGNSGKLVQVQNLPQNHIDDLTLARNMIKGGFFEAAEMLYDSVPDLLSQLIRTAFIPKEGCKFMVADFSAIEARVLSWLAGEKWRMDVFKDNGDIYCASASQMFHCKVEKHGENSELRPKGKIAELALGYGGSVGALTAMGALELGLSEDELQPLVDSWRQTNPSIVKFWWDVDKAVVRAVRDKQPSKVKGIRFHYEAGFLIITLLSGRQLFYAKPTVTQNVYGRNSITYQGVATGKHWAKIESYGPKFVENIIQATSRDILAEAMTRLTKAGYSIVMHIHDECVIEAPMNASLKDACRVMGETPSWAPGLVLNAAGYECAFYQKD